MSEAENIEMESNIEEHSLVLTGAVMQAAYLPTYNHITLARARAHPHTHSTYIALRCV